jgi:hypothetical protein
MAARRRQQDDNNDWIELLSTEEEELTRRLSRTNCRSEIDEYKSLCERCKMTCRKTVL